jgi:hypothetical protein
VIFTYILVRFTSSIILPSLLLTDRFHSYIFICEYKIHPSYSSLFTLSFCPPPSFWYPLPEKVCFALLSFIKKKKQLCIDSPRQFCLGNLGFNHINPHPLPTLYHLAPVLFKSLQCITLYHI